MPASPSTARAINDRLALRLLQQEGPLTAARLKQLTGLSRPTVADLVERLTVSGLITVVGEAGEVRRGPNAKLYGIVADRAHLVALDVRTEGVSVVVSDLVGRVLAEASMPIGGDTGTGPAVERTVALVERVAKEAGADRLHTVGIGAPGLIDPATGELRDSTGLPEWHRQLVAALQERLPEARVSIENETNLAALAEQRDGTARDRDTFVLLWLSHGTGAAVVLDGKLRRGASGGTGEIGFLPVPGTAGLPSATDCEGGFHSLAGAAAIGRLAEEWGMPVPSGSDGDRFGEGTNGATVAALVRGAAAAVREGAGADGGGAVAGSGVVVGQAASFVGGESGGADAGGAVGGSGVVVGEAASFVGGESGGADAGGAVGGSGVVVGEAAWLAAGDSDGADTGRAVAGSGAVAGEAASPAPGGSGVADADGVVAPPGAEVPEAASFATGVSGAADAGGTAAAVGPAVPDGVTPAIVPEAADRFLDALADRLAIGVASVVAVLDPGCVVLGGEVGQAGGAELAGRVQARVRRMSPLATEVRPSVLGGAAVLRGALLTARDHAQDELFAPSDR
ncbi:ROK family protein [Streptomyces sp. NPDC005799]|uniref:ROK family protein n=1 Tax=Streptomyces sp. NPDC005799 TaxID=3154678 RepID=UPI0033D4FC1A